MTEVSFKDVLTFVSNPRTLYEIKCIMDGIQRHHIRGFKAVLSSTKEEHFPKWLFHLTHSEEETLGEEFKQFLRDYNTLKYNTLVADPSVKLVTIVSNFLTRKGE